jgi:pyruvate ferredoxin oxidoreductase delta subunit
MMDKKIYGRGAAVLTNGNSVEVKTGAWKNREPIHLKDKCKNCMFCVSYCPEGCIYQKEGILTKFDLDYCKGCGICAKVCPFKAIEMKELK